MMMSTCHIFMLTCQMLCQLVIWFCCYMNLYGFNLFSNKVTSQHKDLTRWHKDLTNQHNYLSSDGRNMPPYVGAKLLMSIFTIGGIMFDCLFLFFRHCWKESHATWICVNEKKLDCLHISLKSWSKRLVRTKKKELWTPPQPKQLSRQFISVLQHWMTLVHVNT